MSIQRLVEEDRNDFFVVGKRTGFIPRNLRPQNARKRQVGSSARRYAPMKRSNTLLARESY
jgi:hypothetical protein